MHRCGGCTIAQLDASSTAGARVKTEIFAVSIKISPHLASQINFNTSNMPIWDPTVRPSSL